MEPYPTPNLINQDINKILETISFVDKIIFGKLNYNVKSSGFKYTKEFYNNVAETVVRYCKDKRIAYHIKQGTES
jgi:hypothetical protein